MKNTVFTISFAANCLLLFFLIAGEHLQAPVVLQVFGRAHPLLLHLPIGILLLYAVAEIFASSKIPADWRDVLLLVSGVTVAVTALMGLFLSKEEGYSGDIVALHQWTGAAVSFLLLAWYQWRRMIRSKPFLNTAVAVMAILIITITGHFGGNITHGENFLTAPLDNKKPDKTIVPIEEAIVFNHMIQPILEAKCVSCHNKKKAKGELVMETAELLLKGGKNGKLWDTASNNLGLLIERIHLPLDHDDHMPPKGKPQLTESETAILEAWIRAGSDFTVKVMDLPPGDTLKTIAEALFTSEENDIYSFAAASEKDIRSLNNFYRKIQPLYENAPALAVNYFEPSTFSAEALRDLMKIKEQVVQIDLTRMPVTDESLADLATFPNLRKLNLSFTHITGKGLSSLKKLQFLKEISLSGTPADHASLLLLKEFPALKKVYIWNTGLSAHQLASLQKTASHISFETGYVSDAELLKLTLPLLENESMVISEPVFLRLKHKINGARIMYTLNGTEPDSISSLLYHDSILIDRDVEVKTKVFRKGWISSDVKTLRFYISTITPDTVKLLLPPHRDQPGRKELTLFDKELAGVPMENYKSLGYLAPDIFSVTLDFTTAKKIHTVVLNACINTNNNVFEPESITLWYAGENGNYKKLNSIRTPVPPEKFPPSSIGYEFNMPDEFIRHIKIEAIPLQKMPPWHKHPSDKAWLIVDEIAIK